MSVILERNHFVRGADGVLYRLVGGRVEPVVDEAPVASARALPRLSVADDYSAGRMSIEAGDFASGRMSITPEDDYSAGRMSIDPGVLASWRPSFTVDPSHV